MGRGQGQGAPAPRRDTSPEAIIRNVRRMGFVHAYTVGGYHRDRLLGRHSKDVDFAVAGNSFDELLARADAEGTAEVLRVAGQEIGVRLTARWTPPEGIEIALARTEDFDGGGRHAFSIVAHPGVTIEEDLARRDFTRNAIAQDIDTGRIIDPHGGRADIEAGVLRTVSERSFPEDPLRVLRGLVRCAKDGCHPDETTTEQMREWALDPMAPVRGAALELLRRLIPGSTQEDADAALACPGLSLPPWGLAPGTLTLDASGEQPRFTLPEQSAEERKDEGEWVTFRSRVTGYRWCGDIPLSPERVHKELCKLLDGDDAAGSLRLARDTGILQRVLPELTPSIGFDQHTPYHDLPVDEHLLLALERACEQDAPLAVRWAALLHDAGKPETAWGFLRGADGEPRPVGAAEFLASSPGERVEGDDALHFYARPDGAGPSHQEAGAVLARAALDRLSSEWKSNAHVEMLVREHMYAEDEGITELDDRAQGRRARRFLARVGRESAEELLLLRRCDRAAKREAHEEGWDRDALAFEARVRAEMSAPVGLPDLAIDGHALAALGLKGRAIGEAKRALLAMVVEDPELNVPDVLLERARALAASAQEA
jgi:tRNA nucleotidyltransferase/poly(A) polymerase